MMDLPKAETVKHFLTKSIYCFFYFHIVKALMLIGSQMGKWH